MSQICVDGIHLRAYHGCLEEEGRIGGEYVVNVLLDVDFSSAAASDNLHETVDYVHVYNIVKEEMAIRSKLIEHVAQRILNRLKQKFPQVTNTMVHVVKLRPPMNGNVESVSVKVSG